MTGRRHHYIPQFLQRGFNSRMGRATPRAWFYRKGAAAPIETTLRNIGVESSFYRYKALGVDTSADEAITRAEGQRLAPLVQRLRVENPMRGQDPVAVAELFSHIYARTKAVWEIGKMQAPRMFERLSAFARNQTAIRDVLPRLIETQPQIFARLLAPRYPGRDIEEFLSDSMKQMHGVPAKDLDSDIGPMLDGLRTLALRLLQVSKVQCLRELSETPDVAKRFQGCSFSVLELAGAKLVQGDTPVVFYKESGFTPVLAKDEPFEYAFLPITPTRVVVAIVTGGRPESWEALRDASIACSYEHFIAAARYPELEVRSVTIGSGFPSATDADIDRLFAEAVELACTPSWMGPEAVAAIEHLVKQYLSTPQGAGATVSGGK